MPTLTIKRKSKGIEDVVTPLLHLEQKHSMLLIARVNVFDSWAFIRRGDKNYKVNDASLEALLSKCLVQTPRELHPDLLICELTEAGRRAIQYIHDNPITEEPYTQLEFDKFLLENKESEKRTT
jgi:hypothetical protein